MNNIDKIIQDIKEERIRQIEKEGWSENHDNSHIKSELAMAAACYASPKPIYVASFFKSLGYNKYQEAWPWGTEWDKRDKHTRVRQLTIAAALIVAEIERLNRLNAQHI